VKAREYIARAGSPFDAVTSVVNLAKRGGLVENTLIGEHERSDGLFGLCEIFVIHTVQYTTPVLNYKGAKPDLAIDCKVLYTTCMSSTELTQFDNEIIAQRLIKLFTFLMEHPDYNKKEACEELSINYRSALKWIAAGKLQTYLAEIHDVRSDVAQITALGELHSIVRYQAKIARGDVSPQGANPTSAAMFVLEIAKRGARQEMTVKQLQQTNIWMPMPAVPPEKAVTPVIDVTAREIKD